MEFKESDKGILDHSRDIQEILEELECKYNMEILYACESGSRVWGFENDESDYDIRGIFKFKNLKDYVKLGKILQQIDYNEHEYDVVLWNIDKSLNLHYKSNPSLYEWLNSPIVYKEDLNSGDLFKGLPYFDKKNLAHHYSSMCKSQFKKYRDDLPHKVNSKKYLYCTRCILAYSTITEKDMYPPLNIFDLYDLNKEYLADSVKEGIKCFIDNHQKGAEIGFIELAEMNSWILNSIRIMENTTLKEKDTGDYVEIKGERIRLLSGLIHDRDYENYDEYYYEMITGDKL